MLFGDQLNRPLTVPDINENLNDLRPCGRILQFKIFGTILQSTGSKAAIW